MLNSAFLLFNQIIRMYRQQDHLVFHKTNKIYQLQKILNDNDLSPQTEPTTPPHTHPTPTHTHKQDPPPHPHPLTTTPNPQPPPPPQKKKKKKKKTIFTGGRQYIQIPIKLETVLCIYCKLRVYW